MKNLVLDSQIDLWRTPPISDEERDQGGLTKPPKAVILEYPGGHEAREELDGR